jgi:hypothetical protein
MMAIWLKLEAWGSEDGRGGFPPSLSVLTDAAPSLFLCPSSGREPGAVTNVDEWTDYIYVPNAEDWMRVDLAVLICPPENHGGKYGHVVFGGGQMRRLPAAQAKALIKEPWCMPTPARKSISIRSYEGEIPFAEYARTNITVHVPDRFRQIYAQ